jgi:deoxyadenosine/deoxycytidine kinase
MSRMVIEGMDQVEEWVGIHGSIASGKSFLMSRIRRHVNENRLNAADPSHVDADDPTKAYYLLVDEPVDEWEKKQFMVDVPIPASPGDTGKATTYEKKLMSMLEIFYGNVDGFGFEFQVYVFNSRLQRLMRELATIAPSVDSVSGEPLGFKRRIVVISERTPFSDEIFYRTVVKLNKDKGDVDSASYRFADIRKSIYDGFFDMTCSAALQWEKRLIYIPTAPEVCAVRKEMRDRNGEVCDAEYLRRLDSEHREKVAKFRQDRGQKAVIQLDVFQRHLTLEQVDGVVVSLIDGLWA